MRSTLSPVLRQRTRARLQLLFARCFSVLYQRLSKNIVREVCCYFGTTGFLPALDTDTGTMLIYDLETEAVEEVPLAEKFIYGVVCCCVSETDLMAVGGYKVQQTTRVSMLDGEMQSEAPMSEERSWPGVILQEDSLLVFGGTAGTLLKSSEKFLLSSRRWVPLPSMSVPRACFTPCSYKDEIYLPETDRTPKCLEVFDPAHERYRTLPLQLSDRYLGTVAFILQDEMVLFSYSHKMGRWKIGSAAEKLSITPIVSSERAVCACSPPVKVGSRVFWVNSECALVCFESLSNVLRYCQR